MRNFAARLSGLALEYLSEHKRWQLGILLTVALLVRAVVPIAALMLHHDSSVFGSGDTESYLLPAQNLLSAGRFYTHGYPDIHRTPGYPLFLLPGLVVGHLTATTICLQIILSTLTVFLIYRIGLRLAGPAAAFCCAVLYAFEPLSIIFASLLITETVFAFFLVLFIYEALPCIEKPTLGRVVAASLAITLAAYVRPIASYVPFVVAAVLVTAALVAHREKWKLPYVALFLAIHLVLLGAWSLRNYRQAGYAGFSSIGDDNMFFYQGAAIISQKTGHSFAAVQSELGLDSDEQYVTRHPEQAQWTKGQKMAFMGRMGRRLVLENKRIYLGIHLRGMEMLMFDPGVINWAKLFKRYPTLGGLRHRIFDKGILAGIGEFRTQYPFTFYSMLLLGALLVTHYVLACMGFAVAWKQAKVAAAMMAALFTYFVVLGAGPTADARFRHPVMPIVCLFAGWALPKVLLSARELPKRTRQLVGSTVQGH